MNKDIKKILLVLALYALSGGVFYNFQQVWMQENLLSVKTISTIFSLACLLTISTLFICSRSVKKDKIKGFACSLLLTKVFILGSLFFLHNSGYAEVIKFLTMLDFVTDVEIFACIYPLLSQIEKNDNLYAARGIIYDALYYVGVLISCFLLGRSIKIINIDYNTFNVIGALIMLIAFFVLRSVDLSKYKPKREKKDLIIDHKEFNKKILKDKITIYYLIFFLFSNITYYCFNSMTLLLFTEGLKIEPSNASIMIVMLGITSVIVGILILSKLTLKNDYINFSIKYVIRTILYLFAFIFYNKFLVLSAIVFTKITSDSYSHVVDAPYVNRFDSKEQFAFSNTVETYKYLGRAIGTYICGLTLIAGLRYSFLATTIFGIITIVFGFLALYYRLKEKKKK